MKRLWTVSLAVVLLAGCGYRPVKYEAVAPAGMTRQQAVALVQQGFKDGGSNRTKALPVLVTDDYIVRGAAVAANDTATESGTAADDESVDDADDVKEVGRRINFKDIGRVIVYQHRMSSTRYLVVVRSTGRRKLGKLRLSSLEQAERSADALTYLKVRH